VRAAGSQSCCGKCDEEVAPGSTQGFDKMCVVKTLLAGGIFIAMLLGAGCSSQVSSYDGPSSEDPPHSIKKEVAKRPMDGKPEFKLATFGGGCFWCTEAIFQRLNGVEKVVSGYSGGHVDNPTYEQVCTGTTGHAESIQITYDPAKVSYDELLEVFWKTHDPTTKNRQGNDVGPQYRSVVFFTERGAPIGYTGVRIASNTSFYRILGQIDFVFCVCFFK
jgi:hypothetical protein